MTGTPAHEIRM